MWISILCTRCDHFFNGAQDVSFLIICTLDLIQPYTPFLYSRNKIQTMEILRRYCLGSDAVKFQIVSDQKECLRSVVSGRANYEDEFYSVS